MTRFPSPVQRIAQRMALIALLVAGARSAFASSLRETSDFAEVAAQVESIAKQYGAANVLVVSDLDNTLLAMDQDLGSDQWFVWQEYLLTAERQSPELVAHDFDGLLRVQGILFDSLSMHPPQPELPALVGQMQRKGVRTIVLTARSEDFRRDAEQELKAAGYNFGTCALEVANLPTESAAPGGAVYLPYRGDALDQAGITQEEFKRWRLPDVPKGISYRNGICMVAGQHKGAMLAMLLKKSVRPPKAVVFIDQEKQVRRVADAMFARGYDFTGFDYQAEDMKVKRFQYGEKATVTRQWQGMKAALEKPEIPKVQEQPAKAASNLVPAR